MQWSGQLGETLNKFFPNDGVVGGAVQHRPVEHLIEAVKEEEEVTGELDELVDAVDSVLVLHKRFGGGCLFAVYASALFGHDCEAMFDALFAFSGVDWGYTIA